MGTRGELLRTRITSPTPWTLVPESMKESDCGGRCVQFSLFCPAIRFTCFLSISLLSDYQEGVFLSTTASALLCFCSPPSFGLSSTVVSQIRLGPPIPYD
ncbi:hypothetical protein AVEN_20940-1 [Araneus ventricosus]|uniref:Uncharacterized protein n=1 Tax=Araneus ventricosus TaxID=182803 RepID=A0A4Y2KNQ5_ARAVE|nr:hypothetical protein AVEN_20940-1 [Araneus ventricosus]